MKFDCDFHVRLCVFLCLVLLYGFIPGHVYATPATALPRHTLALSFELDKSTVNATSKIDIPAHEQLQLDVSHLLITGTVLESYGLTPTGVLVKNGTIFIAAQPRPQTLFISWQFRATPPQNLISRTGIALTGAWHPLADKDMLYTVQAALPDGFTGISEGQIRSAHKQKDSKIFKASVSFPLQTLHFVAGPYRIHEKKVGDIRLRSFFYPEDDHLSRDYLEKAAQFIDNYQKLLGPFPYPSYAIVENRLPTGYGMAGFTLLGQAVVRLPFIQDTSLRHEIVHSWFGNAVGIAKDSGNWCEGLTTYLADHRFALSSKHGAVYRKKQILRYLDYVHQDNAIPLAEFQGAEFHGPRHRTLRAIGYDKGSMLFHMLQREIGENIFFQSLRNLYKEKKFKRASWQDIEMVFSRSSGQDLSVFFQQWLYRTDIPEFKISNPSFRQEPDKTIVTFHIVQKNTDPYLLRLPVLVTTMTGEQRILLTCKKTDEEHTIVVDALPQRIVLDPDYDIMRNLAENEIPATWARFLGAEDKIVILPDNAQEANTFAPLKDILSNEAVTFLQGNDFHGKLSERSILFAGKSALRESLFAGSDPSVHGFRVQMEKNPLNPKQTIGLINASSALEVRRAARKLAHYGQYSLLLFNNGKITKKETQQTRMGMEAELLSLPSGIPTRSVQDFRTIIQHISSSRVIYVGENHTSLGDHLLQLQIIQALHAKNKKLAIGMEMFPKTAQPILDAYINGEITDEKEFLDKSHYFSVWGFDYRYYRAIIDFARKHHIPVVGLNLDKKIVSKVFKDGDLNSLSEEEVKQIARQRTLALPGYRQRLERVYGMHSTAAHAQDTKVSDQFAGFIQAQALWDETMAASICNFLQKNPQRQMIVIAGAGHVYKDSAIPPRVARRNPGIRQSVLIGNNGVDSGQAMGRAVDYLIFTPHRELPPSPKIGIFIEERRNEGEKGEVVISALSPHGHAATAGLKKGDIILRINDRPVHSIGDIRYYLMDKTENDHVNIFIKRKQNGDAYIEKKVTVDLSD